ncbi:hypothetical protein LTS18_007375 [Coniosporium uncinatum]|uniref:Uncharacterized protein n=1 Tax=Coniosporium uncinatum TaxID=93489 RepID=A0ACC3DCV5_9PEZI|nr:hypothetical protein LTS18_007375 [Coniosporium uncinatum]
MSDSTAFRNIEWGSGGTFTLYPEAEPHPLGNPSAILVKENGRDTMLWQANGEPVFNIGTSECNCCVGLYFRIDETRCFIAHIKTHKEGFEAQAERWKAAFRERMAKEAVNQGWESLWSNPNVYMRSTLTVVCRCPGPMSEAIANELFERIGKPLTKRLRWKDSQIVGFVIEILANHACSPRWLRVIRRAETEKKEAHREKNAMEFEEGTSRCWKSLHVEIDTGEERKPWDFEDM